MGVSHVLALAIPVAGLVWHKLFRTAANKDTAADSNDRGKQRAARLPKLRNRDSIAAATRDINPAAVESEPQELQEDVQLPLPADDGLYLPPADNQMDVYDEDAVDMLQRNDDGQAKLLEMLQQLGFTLEAAPDGSGKMNLVPPELPEGADDMLDGLDSPLVVDFDYDYDYDYDVDPDVDFDLPMPLGDEGLGGYMDGSSGGRYMDGSQGGYYMRGPAQGMQHLPDPPAVNGPPGQPFGGRYLDDEILQELDDDDGRLAEEQGGYISRPGYGGGGYMDDMLDGLDDEDSEWSEEGSRGDRPQDEGRQQLQQLVEQELQHLMQLSQAMAGARQQHSSTQQVGEQQVQQE